MIAICALIAMPFSTLQAERAPQELTLKPGMAIAKSVKVKKLVYNFANSGDDGKTSAITIRADNVEIDFNGATLRGTSESVEPNERKGTAIIVKGKNVTIKNLKLRGYRNGIVAFDSPRIRVIDSDLSYGYKPRLLSTLDKEDGADWMSFHRNEDDQWLRERAPAIYLRRSDAFEVKNVRVVGGQTALMLTESDFGLVWNNNFSFLSAVGVAMYKSSDNRIMHNKIDWCVRGFSFGVYNRGQDSSGIIIYEQSNRNVFAYNSVTHGGDGFFLWAGQTTMDTGKGGCNDNILYGNDFSHSPANGIEATFSRNTFANNLMMECWHGIWGGYGWSSKTVGNVFAYNEQGIAWEHGQDNLVANNLFYRDNEAIAIWSNPTQDPSWGYGKSRDTRSRDWRIVGNQFQFIRKNVFNIARSQGIAIENNTIANVGKVLERGQDVMSLSFLNNDGSVAASEPIIRGNAFAVDPKYQPMPPASALSQGEFRGVRDYLARFEAVKWNPLAEDPRQYIRAGRPLTAEEKRLAAAAAYYVDPLEGGNNPFLRKGALKGWRYILVDQWGPYDFKRPVLWPRGKVVDGLQVFELLGPAGSAAVAASNGLEIDAVSTDGVRWVMGGSVNKLAVPSFVRVRYLAGDRVERSLDLSYIGGEVVDHRGVVTAKGKPFKFGYSQVFIPIEWTVKFYSWPPAAVPSPKDRMPTPAQFVSGKPVHEMKTNQLEFASGGAPFPTVPGNNFITMADGIVNVSAGDYTLNVTTDDGVRIWVDDKLVLDEWRWQGPTPYSRELKLGGRHRIRVEHYEIDGYTALKVELRPKGR